jgi:hypothetical protein
MRTFPIRSDSGQMFAFEMENTGISGRTIAQVLGSVDGVTAVVRRRLFAASPEIHITFTFHNRPYIVAEPFGDNNRYWIGPDDNAGAEAQATPLDASPLEAAIRSRAMPFLARSMSDLVSLLFRSR